MKQKLKLNCGNDHKIKFLNLLIFLFYDFRVLLREIEFKT